MGRISKGLDAFQRRHPTLSVPIAVFYKYVDDQGPYLAAIITYYGFIAIFPLLLLATSILGFLLQGDAALQEAVLTSALGQFPIIGDELGRPEGLTGSRTAVIVGAATALYGSLGLGQALQNAQNIAWSVPRNSRPNPIVLRLKSLVLLVSAGMAVLAMSVASAIASETDTFGTGGNLRWSIRIGSVVVIGLVLTYLFRLAAARRLRFGQAAPGAFALALMFQGLQFLGTLYVTAVLSETEGIIPALEPAHDLLERLERFLETELRDCTLFLVHRHRALTAGTGAVKKSLGGGARSCPVLQISPDFPA